MMKALALVCLLATITEGTRCRSGIQTYGGNAGGACCKFPFKYNGQYFDKCTMVNHDQQWCYTEKEGYWGNCHGDLTSHPGTDSRCKFITGSGQGGLHKWIGYIPRQACINKCITRKKQVDDSINGITVYGKSDGCYCVSGMTYRDDDKGYASCFLQTSDFNSQVQCALYDGDGEGGGEVYLGKCSTRSQCIDRCIKRKNEGDDSINGVTVEVGLNDLECYCEKHMTYRDLGKSWKSCFLRVPDVNANEKCAFFPGDGKGGTDIYMGILSKSECIDVCIKRKNTEDDLINGVTVDSAHNYCYCEKGMKWRNNVNGWKSCFLRIPDPNENKQCELQYGDGEGGMNTWVGYLTRSECIDTCIQRKKAGDDSINGVAVYANEKDKGCYCEKAMTYRDSGKTWKSCILHLTVDKRCNGKDDYCCTKDNPCDVGDGDCDSNDQCAEGLVCGINNCAWGDNDDCCRLPVRKWWETDGSINDGRITLTKDGKVKWNDDAPRGGRNFNNKIWGIRKDATSQDVVKDVKAAESPKA